MKINLKATNIELTPAIQEYAEKRLEKIEQYLQGDHIVAVELGKSTQHHKQGEIFRAEIHITGGGVEYYAAKETEDLYRSIDEVKDEIIHEITREKGKRQSMMRRGGRAVKDMMKGFPWVNFRRKN